MDEEETCVVIRDDGFACQYCFKPFDPISTRYLCPHCKMKNTCCE